MRSSGFDLSREHDDPVAGGLPPLVADRQRVVHSAAFRRLQYKTQVFVAPEGDHYRTRLTHTLEVAHLARLLAGHLALDSGLAEVVALAHDLGHPPFGHAGEQALNECMAGHGGFEHNAHALRVVEYLEHPYPGFRGLNLTRCVRQCLAKHTTRFDRPGRHPLQDGTPPPLEGQVAALADRLAYCLHDLQDGLYAGLIRPADLSPAELWSSACPPTRPAGASGWRGQLRPTVERIQARLVADAVRETRRRLGARGAPAAVEGTVALSPAMETRLGQLEALLSAGVYRHRRLARMDAAARRMISSVFQACVRNPHRMGPRFAARVREQGAHRVAADYVAGMTDRFCRRHYARLTASSRR